MGALSDYGRAKFGVETRYNDTPITSDVAVTPTQIWRNNPDRLMIVFINLGANVVYLNINEGVADDNGIYLGANGGSCVLTAETDGELVGYPWYAISGVADNIFSAEVEGV